MLIILLASTGLYSQTSTITYQGKLLNSIGDPITNSSLPMTFAIYDSQSGGSKLWPTAVASKNVNVDIGLYTVVLGTGSGSDEAFTTSVFAGGQAWLEITVDGTTLARTRLTTVPFSYHSLSLGGNTWAEPGAIGATTPSTGKFTNLTVGTYSFPASDGSNGQVLTTDGSGNVSWQSPGSAPVSSVAETGTTPLTVTPTTGNVQITISQANGTTDGYLSSTDWNTFNNKVATGRTISTTAPLSGGGNLSANRTLSIAQANGTSDGYLSSTDWTTFNNKSTLALGETNATAYRGDRGKAAYDERGSQIDGTGLNWDGSELDVTWGTPGNIGTTTAAEGAFTKLSASSYTFPQSDGTSGYIMLTDGSGNVSWGTTSGLNFDPASPGDIGYTTPANASFTGTNIEVPSATPLTARGSINTNLLSPRPVYVSGKYAYVASYANSRLCIFDISDPDNIAAKGYINTNLQYPKSVYVSGNYAYVASYSNDRLCIFDVSDPTTISAKGYISTNLDGPESVYVSGKYVYMASHNNDRLCIFDVSDPDNIIAKDYISTNLSSPMSVYVNGNYAYVASYSNHRLCIFDISDPDNITAKGFGSTNLSYPWSVYISGSYAYVVNLNNSRLCIFDISDPDNITAKGYTSANLDSPRSVYVSGKYAYVASLNNDRLCIFDISDPDNIAAKGYLSTNLNDPNSVHISGSYAFVTNSSSAGLCAYEINHVETPAIQAGSIGAGDMDIADNAKIGNDLYVKGGISSGRAYFHNNTGIGGTLTIKDYTFPGSDGTNGQVLTTNGSGTVTWQTFSGAGWSLTGNLGTTPGTHFIGTGDNNALEVKVNDDRVARFEPDATSPNILMGSSSNSFSDAIHGAAILGGGSAEYWQEAGDDFTTICGGEYNWAYGDYSFIGGGGSNETDGWFATIGGGEMNYSSNTWSFVGGGVYNEADAIGAVVVGGEGNGAYGENSFIGGGASILNAGDGAFVGGGGPHMLGSTVAVIVGGSFNLIDDESIGSFIGGGGFHTIEESEASVICGGIENSMSSASFSVVCGGESNTISQDYSVIPGGKDNSIDGNYCFAFGNDVDVANNYHTAFYTGTNSGTFTINRESANNGIFQIGTDGSNGNGAYLSAGGTWTNGSSIKFKDRFKELDVFGILDKIKTLRLKGWFYKGTNEFHIWPFSEDFHDTFGTGDLSNPRSRSYLSGADVAGIGLAGVKALSQKVETLESENQELKSRLQLLEEKLQKLIDEKR